MSSQDMTPELWDRIQTVLENTLPMDPEQRAREIHQLCEGDEALIRAVQEYLPYDQQGQFLEDAIRIERNPSPRQNDSRHNQVYGPYRTVEKISAGGMGDVYKAVEGTDFSRVVALKLIKRDMVSGEIVARFRNERKILAELQHPNIAQLYGGGETPDGMPYFAMEYIDGAPIDHYCKENLCSVQQRLLLFLDVCAAVEVAHNHLVVHRDIKPGNILVTQSGVPKLLDFGIARPLEDDMMASTVHTAQGQAPMTVRYASPEMINRGTINIASDIYTLGVVLYELLTGRLPCNLNQLAGAQAYDAIRQIEPLRPSTVVKTDHNVILRSGTVRSTPAEEIAQARGTNVMRLSSLLSGDLDAILLKALAKDPQDRYANVRDFAADLRRHLAGEPVHARQWTFLYGTGKFIRRHRIGVATSLAVLLVVGAFSWFAWSAQAAGRKQQERAETAAKVLEQVFQVDADARDGREISAKQLIGLNVERIQENLDKEPDYYEPEVLAIYLDRLGRGYSDLGYPKEAKQVGLKALDVWQRGKLGDHDEGARILNNIGSACFESRDYACAAKYFSASLEMKSRLGQPLIERAITMSNLAHCYRQQGDFEKAYREFEQVLRVREADQNPLRIARTRVALGSVEYDRGRFPEAAEHFEKALETYMDRFQEKHTKVALVQSYLGRIEIARGSLDSAEPLLEAALKTRSELLQEENLSVAKTHMYFVHLRLLQGRTEEAEDIFLKIRDVVASSQAVGDRAEIRSLQGALLVEKADYSSAESLLLESYRTLAGARSEQATPTCFANRRIVILYEKWGRPDQAAPYRETLSRHCPWAS